MLERNYLAGILATTKLSSCEAKRNKIMPPLVAEVTAIRSY